MLLYKLFEEGEVVTKDMRAALWHIYRDAKRGDALAPYTLGWYHKNGVEGVVKKNPELAFVCFHAAAKRGNILAMLGTACCYASGTGIEQNNHLMFDWSMKAANLDDEEGAWIVAQCYELGEGVDKNEAKAAEWYLKALSRGKAKGFAKLQTLAEQGVGTAQHFLSLCYYTGNGVNKDLKRAVEWMRQAALKGEAWAQYNLGECYVSGVDGVLTKDYKLATEWVTKALINENGTPEIFKKG